jgi:1-aminocyclopropane-1-carboxylate deaminase
MSMVLHPSRVETLNFSEFDVGIQIDILRDDAIHPIVSGNKWRKLKYPIQSILENKNKLLVTFGGAYSNHLIATACAAQHFGLRSFAFVRGDEKRSLNDIEKKCMAFGMELKHVSREAYRDKEALIRAHFENQTEIEVVGEGGRHPLAFKGCQEILNDLETEYDNIVLSVGTGTTMEGLVQGVIQQQLKTKIVGISSLKNNFELDEIMNKYQSKHWKIEHYYHRGKYAKSDAALEQFIEKFQQETHIQLETTYTGKMMMGLIDLIAKGKLETKNKRILCIHTGGVLKLVNTKL